MHRQASRQCGDRPGIDSRWFQQDFAKLAASEILFEFGPGDFDDLADQRIAVRMGA